MNESVNVCECISGWMKSLNETDPFLQGAVNEMEASRSTMTLKRLLIRRQEVVLEVSKHKELQTLCWGSAASGCVLNIPLKEPLG